MKYNELKFEGKIYNEKWEIDEILIENDFKWLVNAEIENARIEIIKNTLVWNSGIWYNGNWNFGVFRDGEWKYGTWENGVWYNGKWRDGKFKSGIIFRGIFMKGDFLGGEIRGGKFIDCNISRKVKEYVNGEKEQEQENKNDVQQDIIEPIKTQSNLHVTVKEKKSYNMKILKNFEKYIKESTGDIEKQFVGNKYDNVNVSQVEGDIELSTYSKTDIYNMQKTHGGEVIRNDDGMYILYIQK